MNLVIFEVIQWVSSELWNKKSKQLKQMRVHFHLIFIFVGQLH